MSAVLQWIRDLFSPALRRARRKRQLEAALRGAGVSKAQAQRAAHAYFASCSRRRSDGQ